MDSARMRFTGGVVAVSLALSLAGCGKAPVKSKTVQGPAPGGSLSLAPGINPGEPLCEDDLNDVIMISPLTLPSGVDTPPGCRLGFAVGRANTILKTEDGGATWRRMTPRAPKGADFVEVTFTSSSNGWAVSSGTLLHTSDAGEHWNPVPQLPGNFYYYGSGSGTATSYHQMQPATYGNRIYRTGHDGRQWTALAAPLPRNDYQSMFFLDDQRGWVTGRKGGLALTTDGGATWLKADIPGGGNLEQIQFLTPACGWARSVREHCGGPWSSRDGGVTWKALDAKVPSTWTIEDMQWISESTGVLLLLRGDSSVITLTTDGGSTWQELGICPPDVKSLTMPSPGEVLAVGARGRLYRLSLPKPVMVKIPTPGTLPT